jgi:hypothetical protein
MGWIAGNRASVRHENGARILAAIINRLNRRRYGRLLGMNFGRTIVRGKGINGRRGFAGGRKQFGFGAAGDGVRLR